jgi:transcriptional regulator with XRE-family HTH domain
VVDRVLEFLKTKSLTPAQFADMIGVQRSSISHLISGRNKPSLEFIQKMLKAFPEINVEWLLSGKSSPGEIQKTVIRDIPAQQEMTFPDQHVEEKIPGKKNPAPEKIQKKKILEGEGKQPEKIVFFFKDNTFREYYPE